MEPNLRENIRLAAEGDERAFAALICAVQSRAYSVAYRYMENDADTRDMLQEAFIKMYRNLRSYKGESSFETWFTRIVINCCLDELRKRKVRGESSDIEEHLHISEPRTVEGDVLAEERRKAVLRAVNSLSEDFRSIIILREFEGLSYGEVAQVLGIEEGTVKSRLNRAKRRLKDILLEQNGGEFV